MCGPTWNAAPSAISCECFRAGVAAARDLGAGDVVEDEFLTLARNTGLAADLGSDADAGLRHVIRWAMLGQNPFQ